MSLEELIEGLETTADALKAEQCGSEEVRKAVVAAYRGIIIPAVRKEIPKKVFRKGIMGPYCPTCLTFLHCREYTNHHVCHPSRCMHCGQSLDWSE